MSANVRPGLGLTAGWNDGDAYGAAGNADFFMLDALVQAMVLDRTLSAPPAAPLDGDRYIVGPSPTGAWSGRADAIANYDAGLAAWTLYTPKMGWTAWIANEQLIRVYYSGAWNVYPPAAAGGAAAGLAGTVMWQDLRSLNNLYAQSIDVNGNVQLAANGIQIEPGQLKSPTAADFVGAIPDGSGRFWTAWVDSAVTVRVQKFDRFGQKYLDPGGLQLVIGTGIIANVRLCTDGASGVIVCWEDSSSGTYNIKAQRVLYDGTIAWTSGGVTVCAAAGDQQNPDITYDDLNGAIICWDDKRSATDVYAQRVLANGTVAWTADGVAVCTIAQLRAISRLPQVCPDGTNGAYVAWQDCRDSAAATGDGFYGTRITSAGSVATPDGYALFNTAIFGGTHNGVGQLRVCPGAVGRAVAFFKIRHTGSQTCRLDSTEMGPTSALNLNLTITTQTAFPDFDGFTVVSDNSNGFIIAYTDSNAVGLTQNNNRIRAARFNSAFTLVWSPGIGVLIRDSTNANTCLNASVMSDGLGGWIVAWQDFRNGASNADIYVQALTPSGAVRWATDGVRITGVANNQAFPVALGAPHIV